jgi:anti-sigma B factor antagonist
VRAADVTARVEQREVAGVTVLAIEGDLDTSSSGISDRLLTLIPVDTPVCLDLSRVHYISSGGLRTLLLVYRSAKDRAARIKLSGLQADVRFIMSATGFLDLFDIDESSV